MNGLLKRLHRLFRPARLIEQATQVVVQRGGSRIESNRFSARPQRLRQPTHVFQCLDEILVTLHARRLERDDLAALRDSLLGTTQTGKNGRELGVVGRERRIQFTGPLVLYMGLLEPALVLQEAA